MIAAVVPRLYPNGQQPYFNGLLELGAREHEHRNIVDNATRHNDRNICAFPRMPFCGRNTYRNSRSPLTEFKLL
jgi:hypothetical protein